MSDIFVYQAGKLVFEDKEFRCSIGRGGISSNKQEGDGTTPAGDYFLRTLYYRPDRLNEPKTYLPTRGLTPEDGWCNDVAHEEYNTFVKLPHDGSYENLWRDDSVYDIIVPLGYNDDPPIPGKGSAIFMHIARPDYTNTEGCVALKLEDFLHIINGCAENTKISIGL